MLNGYGAIYKLHGKRSKPFRAVKTDKWVLNAATGKSKQIRFTIGYYATREEAMIALAEYNENPYDIKADSITFSSNPSSIRTITAAYAYCNGLYDISILQIADIDLEAETMKGGLKTDAGKNRIVPIHPIIKPLIENRMKEADTLQSGTMEQLKSEMEKIPK